MNCKSWLPQLFCIEGKDFTGCGIFRGKTGKPGWTWGGHSHLYCEFYYNESQMIGKVFHFNNQNHIPSSKKEE